MCLVARRGRGRPICDALCPRDVHKMRAEQRHDHVGVDQCVHLWCVHARVLFCGCKHIHLRCKANGHHRRPRARTANALCDRMLRHTHARLSKDTEQNGLLPNKRAFSIDTQWHKYNCSLPVPPRRQSVHRAAAAHLGAQARALFDMQRCVRARRRQRRAKLRRIEQPPLRRWLEDYDREAILVCARVSPVAVRSPSRAN